jgi:hypothetical protein
MLNHELLRDEGILVLKPGGVLEASDFEMVARELDPYIEERGNLRGLLIEAECFPGWSDFAAFISHLRFIRDHHRHIARVAAVSDSAFLSIAPRIASHFVNAEVRHFELASRDAAIAWLRDSRVGGDDAPQ